MEERETEIKRDVEKTLAELPESRFTQLERLQLTTSEVNGVGHWLLAELGYLASTCVGIDTLALLLHSFVHYLAR